MACRKKPIHRTRRSKPTFGNRLVVDNSSKRVSRYARRRRSRSPSRIGRVGELTQHDQRAEMVRRIRVQPGQRSRHSFVTSIERNGVCPLPCAFPIVFISPRAISRDLVFEAADAPAKTGAGLLPQPFKSAGIVVAVAEIVI